MDAPLGPAPDQPQHDPKPLEAVPIAPPPPEQRRSRDARFAAEGEARSRYSLPSSLQSASPVGYRTRVAMSRAEIDAVLPLLSLARPTGFSPAEAVTEGELFEECSLGLLTARQSTNFLGHREVVLGSRDSGQVAAWLREAGGLEASPLDGATHTHLVLTRPYRTPFTLLLTFVGHTELGSLVSLPRRALRKRFLHEDDIPSIGILQQLHLGVLADALERAAVIASAGRRRAQVFARPFTGTFRSRNAQLLRRLEDMAGLTLRDRAAGWRVGLVAQVGQALPGEAVPLGVETARKLGANLMAFRSERIQPGVNAEDKAPSQYQARQDMDVPDELTVMAGRATYNAFAHWTGCDRERAKELMLLERIDVLTPGGKARLRAVRTALNEVTDQVIAGIPRWADALTGRALTRNAERGRKAFALAGQRVYLAGLSRPEVEREGLDWDLAVMAVGAGAARAALFAELMGVLGLPPGCDLLAGTCLMAGPVNQNDIGKAFFGHADLLEHPYPRRGATSLIVWTLKAKTVADPIGNEEQLLNPARQGALVELRPAPHEVIALRRGAALVPLRREGARVNAERAFGDVGNFVLDPGGRAIPGNAGEVWPERTAPMGW